MINKITRLLEQAVDIYDCPDMQTLAKHLVENGILAPPVKIGQTVYTPVPAATPELDEPMIEVWKVQGVAYKGGKWYAIDEYGYLQEIGNENDCLLTKEEAQAELERYENARNTF